MRGANWPNLIEVILGLIALVFFLDGFWLGFVGTPDPQAGLIAGLSSSILWLMSALIPLAWTKANFYPRIMHGLNASAATATGAAVLAQTDGGFALLKPVFGAIIGLL